MIVPSRSTSGIEAVTTPSVRSGSGVVNTSSVGRFGMCRSPAAVVKVRDHQMWVGNIPTRSSVPGPRSSIASNLRAASRSAELRSAAIRSSQAWAGSGSSSRRTCSSSRHSVSSASSSASSGWTSFAQAGCGQGTMHQFVVRSPTIFGISLRYGRWSRPARAGSSPSSRFGAVGPVDR